MDEDLMLEESLGEYEEFGEEDGFDEDSFEMGLEDEDEYGEFYEGEEVDVEGVGYEEDDLATMEALAEMAATTEDDEAADEFIGALIPLAAKVLPAAISIGKRILPRLIRGAVKIGRGLRRSRRGRRMIRALPTIARSTALRLARQVAAGRPVTGRFATRLLARQATRLLRNPRAVHRCIYRARLRALRARGLAG